MPALQSREATKSIAIDMQHSIKTAQRERRTAAETLWGRGRKQAGHGLESWCGEEDRLDREKGAGGWEAGEDRIIIKPERAIRGKQKKDKRDVLKSYYRDERDKKRDVFQQSECHSASLLSFHHCCGDNHVMCWCQLSVVCSDQVSCVIRFIFYNKTL